MGTPHVLDPYIAQLDAAIAAGDMPAPGSKAVWVSKAVERLDGILLLVGSDDPEWARIRIIGPGPAGRRVWIDMDILGGTPPKSPHLGAVLRESWDTQVEQLARQASVVDIFVNGAPRSITNPRGVLNLPKP